MNHPDLLRSSCISGYMAAALLAGLASVTACGCGLAESPEAAAGGGKKEKGGPPPALVRVATVEERKVSPRVIVVGSVIPRRTSVVASGADGIVQEFLVEEGQFVKKGDELSMLRMVTINLEIEEAKAVLRARKQELQELEAGSRPEDLAEAKANMLAAKATADNAAKKLARITSLFERNAVNRDELDDARERAETARQAYSAATAIFDRVKAGPRREQVEQARARYEAQRQRVAFLEEEKHKRITKAPFDGYVVEEKTYVGQWLSKGDPVATLALLDEVDVVVNVDQRDLRHIRPGQTADVYVIGSDHPNLQGTIVSLTPRSEWQSGSRGFPVKVRLTNRFHEVEGQRLPVLKEGMMAEVTFKGVPIDALLVPKDALVRSSQGNNLFVFSPDPEKPGMGTARRVTVTLGLSEGTSIQVIAEELEPGMQVVTEGAERLPLSVQTVRLAPPLTDRHAIGGTGGLPTSANPVRRNNTGGPATRATHR